MKRLVKVIGIIALLSLTLPVSGCWNGRELNDLAIVTGMGIDWLPQSKQYRLSFQVVNPRSVSTGVNGGGGTGDKPIVVYSENGDTLFGSLRKTSRKVSRQLFFSHTQLLVVGEDMARQGIEKLFDFFDRAHEFRLNTPVIVAEGTTAENVLERVTPLEKVTADGLAKRLRVTKSVWAHNVTMQVREVVSALSGLGDFALSGIRIEQKGTLKFDRIAIFEKGKMIGWLKGDAAVGILQIRNQIRSTIVELDCPVQSNNDKIAVELVNSKAGIKLEMRNGSPFFHLLVEEAGNITEVHCAMDLNNKEAMTKLQGQWAKITKATIVRTVKATQQKKSDVLGFGDAVKRSYPKQWKKMKTNWDERYAGVQFDVRVEAYLRLTGMTGKTYIADREK
ncbi:Ger(x)C family spore germination protein [Paenibacillus humicola]|uniref:Ger(x)C family spore germination protein n=1 Tax=Paenibacillus humicola TaxID=3110540 RepID=UPI00237A3EEF|nr:Ger(x)C family spore germination protein [Paenibacillus humicola]